MPVFFFKGGGGVLLQNIMLCIKEDLVEEVSVAVDNGVVDMGQMTGDMWHMTGDTCHMICDTRHVTPDYLKKLFELTKLY